MRIAAIVLLSLLLAGCDQDNSTMAERTRNGRALLVSDEHGNRYTIRHYKGIKYTVDVVDRAVIIKK